MAVKTLTIKEKVYNRLRADKRIEESFSDYFERLLSEKKRDYMRFAGIWDKKTAEEIRAIIRKSRKEDEKFSNEREKRLGLA